MLVEVADLTRLLLQQFVADRLLRGGRDGGGRVERQVERLARVQQTLRTRRAHVRQHLPQIR